MRSRWRGVDELYGLHLLRHINGQIHMNLIALSVKIITKGDVLLCTDSSQSGWFDVETYMHVLRLYFANTAAAKIVIKHVPW